MNDEPGLMSGAVAGIRVPRRTFLGIAGLSAAGLMGARAALASQAPSTAAGDMSFAAASSSAIDDLAASLEYDTERIFRYVADDVWYEPYGGVLRGAAGTLASRAGNSADKSLLLAALLSASLAPTRFVIGTIDGDTADALWTSSQVDARTTQQRAVDVMTETDPTGLVVPGASPRPLPSLPPDAQAARDAIATLGADNEALIEGVTSVVARDVDRVTAALAGAGVSIPAGSAGLPDLELQRHVWVQIQRGPEWIDLDATLPGAVSGQVMGTPVETALPALPDELRHRLETRVRVERTAGAGLEQAVILEHIGFADEMQGLPICLLHDTPEGLQGVGVSIGNAIEGTTQYQPVLMVDEAAHVGLIGLRFAGTDGGGIMSGLGGAPTDGVATAEWLESTAVSPDGRSSTAQRVLFDRIGEEARSAGTYDVAALPPLEMVRESADAPGDYPPLQALHFMSVATGATTTAALADVDPASDSPWTLHVGPYLYHLAHDAANATAGLTHGARIFHDAPNVTRWTAEVSPGISDGSFTTTLDILHRSFQSVPVVGVAVAKAPSIVAGVTSHVAERLALGGLGDSPDTADDVSVGAVFDLAAAQGISTRVIKPGDAIDELPYSAAALRVLAQSLGEGLVAIAPERPVQLQGQERVGWWLFDPSTGALRDQMDDGRGVEMIERAFVQLQAFFARHKYLKLGACVAITAYEAYEILHIAHEASSGGSEKGLAKALGGALATGGAAHKLHHIACG